MLNPKKQNKLPLYLFLINLVVYAAIIAPMSYFLFFVGVMTLVSIDSGVPLFSIEAILAMAMTLLLSLFTYLFVRSLVKLCSVQFAKPHDTAR